MVHTSELNLVALYRAILSLRILFMVVVRAAMLLTIPSTTISPIPRLCTLTLRGAPPAPADMGPSFALRETHGEPWFVCLQCGENQ